MSIKEIKKISESPPRYFGGKARYMWQRVVPILNKQLSVNDLDRTLIESLCVNYQIFRDSYDSIKDNGTQYFTENGLIKSNTAVADIDRASKNIKAACDSLGMTPKSRSDLLNLADSEDEEEIDWTSKFGGG